MNAVQAARDLLDRIDAHNRGVWCECGHRSATCRRPVLRGSIDRCAKCPVRHFAIAVPDDVRIAAVEGKKE